MPRLTWPGLQDGPSSATSSSDPAFFRPSSAFNWDGGHRPDRASSHHFITAGTTSGGLRHFTRVTSRGPSGWVTSSPSGLHGSGPAASDFWPCFWPRPLTTSSSLARRQASRQPIVITSSGFIPGRAAWLQGQSGPDALSGIGQPGSLRAGIRTGPGDCQRLTFVVWTFRLASGLACPAFLLDFRLAGRLSSDLGSGWASDYKALAVWTGRRVSHFTRPRLPLPSLDFTTIMASLRRLRVWPSGLPGLHRGWPSDQALSGPCLPCLGFVRSGPGPSGLRASLGHFQGRRVVGWLATTTFRPSRRGQGTDLFRPSWLRVLPSTSFFLHHWSGFTPGPGLGLPPGRLFTFRLALPSGLLRAAWPSSFTCPSSDPRRARRQDIVRRPCSLPYQTFIYRRRLCLQAFIGFFALVVLRRAFVVARRPSSLDALELCLTKRCLVLGQAPSGQGQPCPVRPVGFVRALPFLTSEHFRQLPSFRLVWHSHLDVVTFLAFLTGVQGRRLTGPGLAQTSLDITSALAGAPCFALPLLRFVIWLASGPSSSGSSSSGLA